ncbi:tetratricopeptide repeat protein 19 homolog, mitochondrial [Anopheles maculipalpis]|uniref:tetratricopeptide repeat protein 19 homolog, mitochondrial n=1 Tax=Anopheles maculipalpis TaxID=1496333 RepID=UPI002158C6CE|nr:tetratricopeptide repeat protein 19 homolog, mitochondrial [Anopheles maculipalpis]
MFRTATATSLASRFFISINHPRIAPLTIPLASLTNHAPSPLEGTVQRQYNRKRNQSDEHNQQRKRHTGPLHFIAASSFLSWFSKKSDDENTPESQLITIIKRSILSIQKEEYQKAEQMLHLALKMAQDLQSKDGITYIYDIMANLAMEVGDFAKAEKLFVNVMQRLFSDGFLEDHIKMLHISSKIAHLAQLQGHLDKAAQGFEWTLAKLEEKLKQLGDDNGKEIRELWGITKNWYAQLLMESKRFAEAKQAFLQAYEAYTEIHGKLTEEGLTILNNLSVACSNLEDYASAERFLKEAISLAAQIPDLSEAGVYKANLGLLYLQQGLLRQASEFCTFAWRYGNQHKHEETVIQATYCLEQIKAMQK